MTPGEWDELAEQVLTRGIQKESEQILTANEDTIVEVHPPDFADEAGQDEEPLAVRRSGRQTNNQGPKRYGSPVLLETDTRKFETDTGKPTESKFELLGRRVGHSSLHTSK